MGGLEPIPDGQTVPHQVEAAEVAELWAAGQRRARLYRRGAQAVFWLCCFLVPTLIVLGSVRHQ